MSMSLAGYPSLGIAKINVLVTGSSGFLGQHVIKLLQEDDETIETIICYDLKPYKNDLGHKTDKPMKIVTGDIRDKKTLLSSLEDVDCIIHCAAKVSAELDADEEEIYSVNVSGTETLLDAAIECNVRYFVHVSDVSVVCGQDPIYYGAENTTLIPKYPSLGAYAKSKYEAELRVAKKHGASHQNGSGRLSTIILRPTVIYGEGDHLFVTEMLKIAKESDGRLQRVDNIFTRTQTTYAGNAAWACLKAKDRLRIDPKVGGEEFFITDDTPVQDPFEFAKPFLEAKGFKVSEKALPYWVLLIGLSLIMYIVALAKPFYKIKLPEKLNPLKLRYVNTTYFFNRTKSVLRLAYEPRFLPEESAKRALKYYQNISL